MNQLEYISDRLRPFRPALEINELVVRLNVLYHKFEAAQYDKRHPEITERLPALWGEMISVAADIAPSPWRVLNFGCGSGFEASQVISKMGARRIEALSCYDPSPEMLEICRSRLARTYPGAKCSTVLDDVLRPRDKFNILITNSVLHHLPDLPGTVQILSSALSAQGVWLAGHEPSRRYLLNPECQAVYREFRQWRRWRRALQLDGYANRLLSLIHLRSEPARQAAAEALRLGLFNSRPPAWLIGRLVDLHVCNDLTEANCRRGFDPLSMEGLSTEWQPVWTRTYAYMGAFFDGNLPQRWRDRCDKLAHSFPDDGANFCMILKRGLPDSEKAG